ncbi:MAG: hypothetical protein COB15_10920 [Flavobacteriales bacterium]|nr:MAG: hypothetical protein COB15_10920 [Flavobacteriales bacterium]
MTTTISKAPFSLSEGKYGVTEKKKEELDELQINLLKTQRNVDQEKAIVTALSEKSEKLKGFLTVAGDNSAQALSNRNLVDEIITLAENLQSNSKIAFSEMAAAKAKTQVVSVEIKALIDKLIFSAELINKLSNLVIRKKAQNPLISNELVAMVGAAGADANNAVALTLVALKSAYTALSSGIESRATTALQYNQVKDLYTSLTGISVAETDDKLQGDSMINATKIVKSKSTDSKKVTKCIKELLYEAYENALVEYEILHKASIDTTKQLSSAKAKLDKEEVQLTSYKSGMAAATAAALA